jgi:predicted phage-related endonuclease
MTDSPNRRAAADRLHDLREQIKELEAEEQELRQAFIAGELPLIGDEYVAVVTTVVNERLDLRRMREHVPEDVWRPYAIETQSSYVTVRRRKP